MIANEDHLLSRLDHWQDALRLYCLRGLVNQHMVEVKVVEASIGRGDAGRTDHISILDDVVLCLLLELFELHLLLVGQLLLIIDHLVKFLQLVVEGLTHVS